MENFGRRTTLILAAVFLTAMLGWAFSLEKMADTAPVHCDCHFPTITCAPASKV
jgi:hypothetical protein